MGLGKVVHITRVPTAMNCSETCLRGLSLLRINPDPQPHINGLEITCYIVSTNVGLSCAHHTFYFATFNEFYLALNMHQWASALQGRNTLSLFYWPSKEYLVLLKPDSILFWPLFRAGVRWQNLRLLAFVHDSLMFIVVGFVVTPLDATSV